MDKIKETIEMLECIKVAAEPIQTPDIGCGYSTLITNVKCDDSFTWVIDEAISLLEELQNIKTQQGGCENCDYRKFTEKLVDGFVEVMNEYGITSVEQLSEILKGGAR